MKTLIENNYITFKSETDIEKQYIKILFKRIKDINYKGFIYSEGKISFDIFSLVDKLMEKK